MTSDDHRPTPPRGLVDWIARHELGVLLALSILAVSLWAFVEIVGEVFEGDTDELDRRAVLMLRSEADPADPLGPLWLEEAGRDLTAMGGSTVLTLIALAVLGYLLLQRKLVTCLFVLVAVCGGLLLSTLLKAGFSRPRPDVVPHLSHVATSSFPSGHAMNAAVVYLTLGVLLARLVDRRRVKTYFLAVALLLAGLVGVSRVYMGVHYPTDVLAGWAAGMAWAMVCWLAARYLQARGVISQSIV